VGLAFVNNHITRETVGFFNTMRVDQNQISPRGKSLKSIKSV